MVNPRSARVILRSDRNIIGSVIVMMRVCVGRGKKQKEKEKVKIMKTLLFKFTQELEGTSDKWRTSFYCVTSNFLLSIPLVPISRMCSCPTALTITIKKKVLTEGSITLMGQINANVDNYILSNCYWIGQRSSLPVLKCCIVFLCAV